VKVLKKVFYQKPGHNPNGKFAWLLRNSAPVNKPKKSSSFGKNNHNKNKKMKVDEGVYVNLRPSKAAKEIPVYLNQPKKKKSLPVPKNTLRSQDDIIVKIENIYQNSNQNKENIHESELINEPLTDRNLKMKSKSRDKVTFAKNLDNIDSGCQSDRSHLKQKSLFSKLTDVPRLDSKFKKVFTFKEEAFESKYLNSFGSSNDILSKVRISFAPNEDTKNIKTSIMDTVVGPNNKHKLEKPDMVEFSTPSGTKNEKISFDLKLDLHSLKNNFQGAQSERNHLKQKIARGFNRQAQRGLDFIPERSSEHNFEGKLSLLGKCFAF
jgi:hypothetical protein